MIFEKIINEKRNDVRPPFLVCNGTIGYDDKKYNVIRSIRIDADEKLFEFPYPGEEYTISKVEHPSSLRQDGWVEYQFGAGCRKIFGGGPITGKKLFGVPSVEEIFSIQAERFLYFITANHIDLFAVNENKMGVLE